MRTALVLALAVVATSAGAQSLTSGREALTGSWTVDLRLKSTDPVYERPMRLQLADDGTVTGLFYQSEIEAGRWKSDRGRTCVSFRTNDSVTPYHTAACLNGDQVEGQTWAERRNFLFVWDAVRAPAESN